MKPRQKRIEAKMDNGGRAHVDCTLYWLLFGDLKIVICERGFRNTSHGLALSYGKYQLVYRNYCSLVK